tara:strand:- start:464 stop:691 length:228 start_codon:yes stop_codon:yes gene_type:complete
MGSKFVPGGGLAKPKGKKNHRSRVHSHMDPDNLRKGYTNTKKVKEGKKIKSKGYHKEFDRNGQLIKLLKKNSIYI